MPDLLVLGISLVSMGSLWLVLLCLVGAALASSILYYKDKRVYDKPYWRLILWALRFLMLALVLLLLVNPMLVLTGRRTEKPIVVIAQDNSRSITVNKDSIYYKSEYLGNLNKLVAELGDKYDVKTFSFGQNIKDTLPSKYDGSATDISAVLNHVYNLYSGRNIGAVVVASDGLYNTGIDPSFAARKISAPIYTLALGDTNAPKDLLIAKVEHNRIAYLGDEFPVQVQVEATKLKSKSSRLSVFKGGQSLFNQVVPIAGDNFFVNVPLSLKATDAGVQKYTVKLQPVDGEISKLNNTKDFFIDVIDGRMKVLILANSPHPDIAALHQAIEKSDKYEVETSLLKQFQGQVEKFNMVILHQLPSLDNNAQSIVNRCKQAGIPILYVLGAQTSLSSFNNLSTGLFISARKVALNDAAASIDENFPLFTLSENARRLLSKMPPLKSFFGSYRVSPNIVSLMNQKIGSVYTDQPLLMFDASGNNRIGIVAGEGIWRWRLAEYAQTGNSLAFEELTSKIVQYLCVKLDKSLFRVLGKKHFMENENVIIDAELYNESYELINEPDVKLSVVSSTGKHYEYVFNKTARAYILNIGVFPVGDYSYEATVKQGTRIHKQKGLFSVSSLQIETTRTVADHRLMYSLAVNHGGEMFYPKQLDKLKDALEKREDIKTVSYSEKQLRDVVGLKWLFFLILAFLTAEWFIRKRMGDS